jgi:hypothetical protein
MMQIQQDKQNMIYNALSFTQNAAGQKDKEAVSETSHPVQARAAKALTKHSFSHDVYNDQNSITLAKYVMKIRAFVLKPSPRY